MKIKNLILAAFAFVALAACQEKEPELGPAGILADKTTVEFESGVSSTSISVTATRDWNAVITYTGKSEEKWLTVTPSSGKGSNDAQKIEITALANDGYNRYATVKFTIGLADAVVTVSQKGPKGEASPYDAEQITCAEFLQRKDTQTDYILEGTISGVTNSSYIGFDLNDGTGTVPCAFPTNFDEFASQLKNGCKVKIMGKYNYYEKKGTHQMQNGTIISVEEGEPLPEAAASTVKDFIDRKDTNTQYVLTGTASECAFGTSYWGFVLTDETGSVQCPFPANWDEFKDKISDGSTVKIQGAYSYFESKDADQLKNGTILSVTGGAPAEQHVYEGIVVAVSKVAFLIKTEDSYKYAYDKEKVPAVALGDMVKLSGELSMYGNLEEVINYTVEVLSSGNAVNHPEIKKLSGADMDTYETMFGYVGFTGKLSISGNYFNVTVEGSTKTGSLASANNVDAALNGKIVDCEGYFIGLTGKDKYFNIILTSIKASDDQSGSDPGEGGNPGGGGETGNWTRVTTVAELLAGGTFIIGYEATANSGIIIPMANTGSASTDAVGYIYSGSTAVAGGKETINMSSVSETSNYEVTIVPSTSVSGAICIKLGANYLGNTNTKNNCKLFTTEATTTAFTPTVGDNDVFTLTIEANDSYNTLQYNAGSPRFAGYKATQNNVVIYKKNK